jgi:hypothetical protein
MTIPRTTLYYDQSSPCKNCWKGRRYWWKVGKGAGLRIIGSDRNAKCQEEVKIAYFVGIGKVDYEL